MTNDERRTTKRTSLILAAAGALALLGCGPPPDPAEELEATAISRAPVAPGGLQLAPVLAAFPVTAVGQPCDVPEFFTVTNAGATAVAVELLLDGDSFRIAHSECDHLLPGRSCQLEVRFTPTGAGPRYGTLEAGTGAATVRASLVGLGQGPSRSSPRPHTFDFLERGSQRLPVTEPAR